MKKEARGTSKGRGGARPGAGRKPGVVPALVETARQAAKEEATKHVVVAWKALAHVAARGKTESARVSAAIHILDRAYGRVPQPLEGPGGGDLIPPEVGVGFAELAKCVAFGLRLAAEERKSAAH